MALRRFNAAVFLVSILQCRDVAAQSAKSCGGANDLLQDVTIFMTPDPPVAKQEFTIKIAGNLSKAVDDFVVKADVKYHGFYIITSTVNVEVPVLLQPSPFVQGAIKLDIGPITLPPATGPTTMKGQIHAVTAAGEPLLCVDLDFDIAGESAVQQFVQSYSEEKVSSNPVTSCTKSTDHLKNFNMVVDDGVMMVSGRMDEDLSTLTVDLDVTIRKWFVSVPFKGPIPVTMSPSLPKGHYKMHIGPATGGMTPRIGATVSGKIILEDEKQEEVMCLEVSQPILGNSCRFDFECSSTEVCKGAIPTEKEGLGVCEPEVREIVV